MSSRFKTGKSEEALLASPAIVELAREILSPEQFDRAMELSEMLVSSKSKKVAAREELKKIAAPPPKRPLGYAEHEIDFLPHWTREIIRYMGDYVDQLTKHMAYELAQNERIRTYPLGQVISYLETNNLPVPRNIMDWLKKYNSFLYRPGKHDFTLPFGRKEHRFTSREAVLTIFVSVTLGRMIRQISKCRPHLDCHLNRRLQ